MDRAASDDASRQRALTGERMAVVGKLAVAVAHELNSPLSGMLMYARLVERELDGLGVDADRHEECRRYLRQIQHDARRCGAVVAALLRFARPAPGGVGPNHLNDVVARSVALVAHLFDMTHVQLEAAPMDADDAIPSDASSLEHVVVALLVNFAETMPRGGRVSVRAAPAEESIALEIHATPRPDGPRGPEPATASICAPGAGAPGLPGVDLVVRAHGGSVVTAPDGMTVRVVLPRGGLRGVS